MRILIADDHELMRSVIRDLIASGIHEVCGEAVDGDDAKSKAMQLKPDVIVMDLSLPGMNGFQASREILKFLPETAIVIFSQHSTPNVAMEAFRAGARGYVLKSAAARDLLFCIEMVSQNRRFISPSINRRLEKTALLF